MLRHLRGQRRVEAYMALVPLTAAAILALALVLLGAPRGLWSAPYLAVVLALSGARAAGRWMALQDLYLRARGEVARRGDLGDL
ncbi:hypothetical protein [Kocuria sp. PD6]|uniref:hypothetical protein n=1 Tax=Kocuria sp. PD6 TaxID=2962590 RepID=UPI0028819E51|nr:hypothetical protein [Kocuria sp. PD6]MDT0120718.1 hypothetical protein [Kocuria sp. PD6]